MFNVNALHLYDCTVSTSFARAARDIWTGEGEPISIALGRPKGYIGRQYYIKKKKIRANIYIYTKIIHNIRPRHDY